MKITRREFLGTAGAGAVCACAVSLNGCSMLAGVSKVPTAGEDSFSVDKNAITLTLSRVEPLNTVGGAVKFSYQNDNNEIKKVLVVRKDETTYLAFSDSCTHGKRELNYLHDRETLQCSSFGHSKFDLSGKVLGGPAKEALTLFSVVKGEDKLVITA